MAEPNNYVKYNLHILASKIFSGFESQPINVFENLQAIIARTIKIITP